MPLIYVIILNWNGWELTRSCLESLSFITYPHFRILVVDNGSTDGSSENVRKEFPLVELIETGENLGFAEGNNRGITYALHKQADYVLLLNNDTVVDPLLLQEFVAKMKELPDAGILGAKIYLHSLPTHLDHLGGMWNPQQAKFDLIGYREPGENFQCVVSLDYVCGCAFFVSRAVFAKIGFLDPRFFLFWEESDFCFRARNAGWKVYSIPTAKVWHRVSASFVGGKPHSTYFSQRNRLLWLKKHDSRRVPFLLLQGLFRFSRLYTLKSLHLFFGGITRNDSTSQIKRRTQLRLYRAALHGLFDYIRRRFGNGPSWIYK